MKSNEYTLEIGEIYMMNFTGEGSEQQGWRPGLIFQNNKGNQYSPNVIALPLTSAIKKMNQPTHIKLSANETGLIKDSVVLCENPKIISKAKIGKFITKLSDEYMQRIAIGSLLASSAIAYLTTDVLINTWETARRLNTV